MYDMMWHPRRYAHHRVIPIYKIPSLGSTTPPIPPEEAFCLNFQNDPEDVVDRTDKRSQTDASSSSSVVECMSSSCDACRDDLRWIPLRIAVTARLNMFLVDVFKKCLTNNSSIGQGTLLGQMIDAQYTKNGRKSLYSPNRLFKNNYYIMETDTNC